LCSPRTVVIESAKACCAGQSCSHLGSTDDRGRDNIRVGRQLDNFVGAALRHVSFH
jgi:hypothetical protein